MAVEVRWAEIPALEAVRDRIRAILTEAERARHAAFYFDKNKDEYLLTRALERAVLANATGRSPGELRFVRSEFGRPSLVDDGELRFNLTNTVTLTAIVVARGHEVGIDAEPLERADTILDVVETVFTSDERAALAALPAAERRVRAVSLWTLKESYMKARGLGFSLPPTGFAIDFEPGPPRLRLVTVDDDAERWSLAVHRVQDHVVATCVEFDDGIDIAPADLSVLLR